MTQKEIDAINDIMDNFNFHDVAKIMKALDWKWIITEKPGLNVPEEFEIRKFARRLLEDAIRAKIEVSVTSSGGLRAKYDREYEELTLEFIAVEYDTIVKKEENENN